MKHAVTQADSPAFEASEDDFAGNVDLDMGIAKFRCGTDSEDKWVFAEDLLLSPRWLSSATSIFSRFSTRLLLDYVPTLRRNTLHVGYLGTKTSSEDAVNFLMRETTSLKNVKRVPFASFDELFAGLAHPDTMIGQPGFPTADLAIIPAASKDINQFFMCRSLHPVVVFYHATPTYGLVCRHGTPDCTQTNDTVAYFPVTRPVLSDLQVEMGLQDCELIDASSTADAASMVASGRAKFAVTNEDARRAFDLEWHRVWGVIPMVWIGFARKSN